MKIGVLIESFREGLQGGLIAAVEMDLDGVQMSATSGETRFDALKGADRKDLLKRTQDLGLEFSALCGDFGGHGFEIAEDNPLRVDNSKRIAEMALDLGCDVVTTHIGVLPTTNMPAADRPGAPDHPRWRVMLDGCSALAEAGRSMGVTFAIETGPEPAAVLRQFIDQIDSPGIGVNLDPANLAMVIDEDIVAAADVLGPRTVHTHAKDGRNLKPCDAEALYGAFAVGGIEALDISEFIEEVPLGRGQVPWPAYLAALRDAGFDGYLTVEREVGASPRDDIALAVDFLKNLLKDEN